MRLTWGKWILETIWNCDAPSRWQFLWHFPDSGDLSSLPAALRSQHEGMVCCRVPNTSEEWLPSLGNPLLQENHQKDPIPVGRDVVTTSGLFTFCDRRVNRSCIFQDLPACPWLQKPTPGGKGRCRQACRLLSRCSEWTCSMSYRYESTMRAVASSLYCQISSAESLYQNTLT